jgi:hypothetical protein
MNIQERLALFYRRLEAVPAAADADEAMQLVCHLIEQVEDEFCPLPREEPPPLKFTGRMYAPGPDRMRRLPQGGLVADTRHHRVYCQPNGAISIMRMADRKLILSKPGKKQ